MLRVKKIVWKNRYFKSEKIPDTIYTFKFPQSLHLEYVFHPFKYPVWKPKGLFFKNLVDWQYEAILSNLIHSSKTAVILVMSIGELGINDVQ